MRDQLDMLVCQLIRQGLEPIDLTKPSAADALMTIASVLPPNNPPDGATINEIVVKKTGWIIVDSYVSEIEIAPGKTMKLPVPQRVRTLKEPSATWQRVIDRVLQMPEKQVP